MNSSDSVGFGNSFSYVRFAFGQPKMASLVEFVLTRNRIQVRLGSLAISILNRFLWWTGILFSFCHVGSHSVTCYTTQVHTSRLNASRQAGTRFTYREGMEGWVNLVDLIAPRPGVEPATFLSRVQRSTTVPPRQQCVSLSENKNWVKNLHHRTLYLNQSTHHIERWHQRR